jgi:hypothetical protein
MLVFGKIGSFLDSALVLKQIFRPVAVRVKDLGSDALSGIKSACE